MTASVRAPSDVQRNGTVAGLRECPTRSGDFRSLITHRIHVPLCMQRQREHYHKCHRCLFRGQSAAFVIEERIRLSPVAETGVPKERVDLPVNR